MPSADPSLFAALASVAKHWRCHFRHVPLAERVGQPQGKSFWTPMKPAFDFDGTDPKAMIRLYELEDERHEPSNLAIFAHELGHHLS